MRTGYTYRQRISDDWDFVDRILRLANRDLNARSRDFDIDLELSFDESSFVESESRLYQICIGDDYDTTLEVEIEDEEILISPYSSDGLVERYCQSVGRVLRTSPADWP